MDEFGDYYGGQGPAPGLNLPGAWDPYSGKLSPASIGFLRAQGVDPTDSVAVYTYFTTGYYAVARRRPYWWDLWTAKHPEVL